jgi:hypothetical protein
VSLLRPAGLLEDERGLHMVTLSVLLLKELGSDYIAWESDALYRELRERFGLVGVVTWERIQAVRLLHTNSAFWSEWEIFENVVAAAVGAPPIFSLAQPPEAEDIAIAMAMADQFDSREYSDEVQSYIVSACLFDGTWYLDSPLDIAMPALLEYDGRLGISRDFGSVAARLQQISSYIQEPETAVDVQVNNVISVRKALAEYHSQVESQMKELL